ncbi:septation protein SepH [Nocardia sp. NPDC058633]|uniref:septation protein SepH n=1 Tax=Nocardia sp. NPDC058633 TaxID=3346568 RepID=UPI00365A345F
MRELRVIGVTPDSTHIVCSDTESGTKFRLPADDKLRAAARGDLARFGQIEIETEATMRPRDIQARIRAGASVEQVTTESGMPESKVERFAYPVLLERARAAELAQKAHPVRPDGPSVETLHEIVTAAFAERGHTIEQAEWDAWKDEKGFWVAQLQWRHGHSEIAAHWRYQPDAHGGSVSPLDDPATDLIDPDFGRSLRGLATILPTPVPAASPVIESPIPVEPRPREHATPTARPQSRPAPNVDEYYEQRQVAAGGGTAAIPTAPIPAAPVPAAAAPKPATPMPAVPTAPTQPAAQQDKPVAEEPVADKPAPKPARTKRGKAPMPSWEDVLLGVRSSGN